MERLPKDVIRIINAFRHKVVAWVKNCCRTLAGMVRVLWGKIKDVLQSVFHRGALLPAPPAGEMPSPVPPENRLPEQPPPAEAPVPAPSTPPASPADGRGVWIWRLVQVEDGNILRIIERALRSGLNWIAIKGGDGTSRWVQLTPEVVRKIQETGLKMLGWVYAYGNNPKNEAEVARSVLRLGCDGLIIDAEAEFEGKQAAVEQYLSLIRAEFPDAFIAFSSFPLVSKHPSFPYKEFGAYCDAAMPQCYWRLIGFSPEEMLRRARDEWAAWGDAIRADGCEGLVVPLYPVGQGFGVNAEEISRFREAAKDFPGVSLWNWTELTPDEWQAFSG